MLKILFIALAGIQITCTACAQLPPEQSPVPDPASRPGSASVVAAAPDDDPEAAVAAYDPHRGHLEQIEALAPLTWLKLGKPACDPEWGCARGRSWTPKMPYHNGSAYLYGEGVHAFVRPDGYYDDSLFAYRVAQHAWVALWPGTPTANPPDLRVADNGLVTTADGESHPLARLLHGYYQTAFDAPRKRFVFMPWASFYAEQLFPDQMTVYLQSQRYGPWYWDVESGRWGQYPSENAAPGQTFTSLFVADGGYYYRLGREFWRFTPGDTVGSWERLTPSGSAPQFGNDAATAVAGNHVYFAGGIHPAVDDPADVLVRYDIRVNDWQRLTSGGERPPLNMASNNAVMNYDAASNALIVLLHNTEDDERGLWSYDIDNNRWERLSGLPSDIGRHAVSGFYAPDYCAHFFFVAPDSSDAGEVWAYRHRPTDPGLAC